MNVLDMVQIDLVVLYKVLAFGFASILGMTYSYTKLWAEGPSKKEWSDYMFGDKKAIFKSFSTLLIMCVGAGGLSMLDGLSGFGIFIAGASVGYLVPSKVQESYNVNALAKTSPHSDKGTIVLETSLESANSPKKVEAS